MGGRNLKSGRGGQGGEKNYTTRTPLGTILEKTGRVFEGKITAARGKT